MKYLAFYIYMKNLHRSALLLALLFQGCQPATRHTGWPVSGGSKENIRYSSLTQVNKGNVARLQQAWIYHTGDADTVHNSQIQCNPVVQHGVLYGTSPQLKLVALQADTGKPLWVFDPAEQMFRDNPQARFALNNNRGVTWWEEGADRRILYAAGNFVYAVDARTGQLVSGFGEQGKIDLKKGLDKNVDDLYVAATSPGIVYQNLYIIGSRVSEGSDAAPGHIRAYDVRTGERAWIFHTIPQPGQFGHDTWDNPDAYQRIGGANAWSGFSLDEKRGIVFAGTGSASFDYYGGKRTGANLFANCILALNARTGERIWHYQTVHHDTWDYDLPTAPALVTVRQNGKRIDAVAQPTKTGFVFLLNRETGAPLFPIDEVPVPTDTELKGEKLWPTQPMPTRPVPFMRQQLTEEELNDLVTGESYEEMRARFRAARSGGLFTPQSLRGTVVFPGLDGGAEWGGPAFDPESQYLYINANEVPWLLTMKEVDMQRAAAETYGAAGERLYTQHCMSCHGADRAGAGNNPSIAQAATTYQEASFQALIRGGRRMMPAFQHLHEEEVRALSAYVLNMETRKRELFPLKATEIDSFLHLPYTITGFTKFQTREGYPAIKPPWGSLNAINLSTGEAVWKVPLGEYPELAQKGIITGTENYGGPVVTAGGLVFIAATRDRKFRAFDKDTGTQLWETTLPAAGFATPAVYEVNGKQFVVVACGGGKLGTKSGDAYVAFALPE